MLADIHLGAVLLAALSAFVLGGVWYSPWLFGKVWQCETGWREQDKTGHEAVVYMLTFLLSLLSAALLALFLGHNFTFHFAVGAGVLSGVIVAAAFGINYLFASRSLKLFLIDGGYHVVRFTLYGIILGLLH